MKITKTKKNKYFSIALILFITMSSFLTIASMNSGMDDEIDPDIDVRIPVTAAIGDDPWWNGSFQYRKLINVTNPGNQDLTDIPISVVLTDYSTLVADGKLRSDLTDVRIVENGVVRDFYVKTNFALATGDDTGKATIWFEHNSTMGETDYDTYLYYGNTTDITFFGPTYMDYCPDGSMWFDFEDCSGNADSEILDLMYEQYNGTLRNTVSTDVVSSHSTSYYDYGNAFEMRPSDYIALNMSFTNNPQLERFSASAWVNIPSGRGGWSILDFDRSEMFTFAAGDDGYYPSTGEDYVEFDCTSEAGGYPSPGQGDTHDMIGSIDVADDTWHFLTVTFDCNEEFDKKIYVDGYLDVQQDAYPTGEKIGDSPFEGSSTHRYGYIGDGSESTDWDGNRNGHYYYGILDDVRYFDYALTPEEIEWMSKYYPITTVLNEEKERAAIVTIIVKDIDGRRISGAEVSLWNGTTILDLDGSTYVVSDTTGVAEFSGVPYSVYNITVNYTIASGLYEQVVYDSSALTNAEVDFRGLECTHAIYVDLWTIDFAVVDINGDPLNYGIINISQSGTSEVLGTLDLDADGKSTFIWLASLGAYNYSLYYDNTDYFQQYTFLNSSTITHLGVIREFYNVNSSNIEPGGSTHYRVVNSNYASDSVGSDSSITTRGNNTVVEATLIFNNMQDNISDIEVYFYTRTGEYLEEQKSYPITATTDEQLHYNIVDDEIDEIFGVRVDVQGNNLTDTCDGTIEFNITQSYLEYIKTDLSKLSIKVKDSTGTEIVQGVEIRVENFTGGSIVNLTTDTTGYAFGGLTKDFGMWYTAAGQMYNFTLWIINIQQSFKVNITDKPKPSGYTDVYNYTLTGATTIQFNIATDFTLRKANFTDEGKIGPSQVTWGENMTFYVMYNTTDENGLNWEGDWDRGGYDTSATWIVYTNLGQKLFERQMVHTPGGPNGNFTVTVNSSLLSAGGSFNSYLVYVTGTKPYWTNPTAQFFSLRVNAKPTGISLHNYTTKTAVSQNVLSQYEIIATYGEVFNISARYYDNATTNLLAAESFSYSWIYGSGSINIDPLNSNYYYFLFDTTDADYTGTFNIYITATCENYTSYNPPETQIYTFLIVIVDTPTTLNGSSYPSNTFQTSIYIKQAFNFTFEYNDTLTHTRLTSLTIKNYEWHKLDDNNQRLYGTGNEGFGNLIETPGGLHVLDINTETLSDGNYQIDVNIYKRNYGFKYVSIPLTINKRPIDCDYTSVRLSGVQGTSLDLTLTLTDSSNSSVLLTGVTIYLVTSDGLNISIDPVAGSPGMYHLSFPTTKYNTFIMPQTLTGTIYMNKADHETKTIPVTIVVGMTEIFPGMPMFYFLMIVGAISAVAVSLITYRTVQQRRIPTFVKKTKAAMKTIDSKGKISESLIYPPKEEYIVKLLGERWASLDLSLEDILGVQGKKKGKTAPSSDVKSKDIGGGGM